MRVVCVLGMHRSGTSAIAAALGPLGVNLGADLLEAYEYNEKGLFEDREINALNEEVLARVGSSWHALAAFDDQALNGKALAAERRRAIQLLRARLTLPGVFGFKDPRTSILLPFWVPIFKELDIEPSFVIAVRNPIEVADSLTRRDGTSRIKGYVLWLKYMLAADLHTAGSLRVFVSYRRLMDDAARELTRISQALDLPITDMSEVARLGEEFLDASLQHSTWDADAVARSLEVPSTVKVLFPILDARSRASAKDVFPAIDSNHGEAWLRSIDPVLEQVDRLDGMLSQTWADLSDLRQRHESDLRNLQELRASDQSAAAERSASEEDRYRTAAGIIADLEQRLREANLQISVNAVRAERLQDLQNQNEIQRAETESARREANRAVVDAALQAQKIKLLMEQMQLQSAEADRVRDERSSLRSELEWLRTELGGQRDRLEQKLRQALHQVQTVSAEAASQVAQLNEARATISALKASTSWWLTSPVRAVSRLLGGHGSEPKPAAKTVAAKEPGQNGGAPQIARWILLRLFYRSPRRGSS